MRRLRRVVAILLFGSLFLAGTRALALPESQIRLLVNQAKEFEKQANWEEARKIYEALLSQRDYGLDIRGRYNEAMRRCRQLRRHQDPSYTKEVLSIEYGQASRVYSVITNSLLDSSVDKKKVDPSSLFRKGLEELDAALSDANFLQDHVPASKHGEVSVFRAYLKETWGESGKLTRKESIRQLGNVALAAEKQLGLNPTVVAMEIACGACYAIDEYTVYLTPNQLRELTQSLSRTEAIGVGVTLTIRENRIVIHDIAMDSPLLDLLSRNDEIIAIDKKPVVDLPLASVKALLEGSVGSMVEIQVLTGQDMRMETIRVQRRAALASVTGFMIPGSSFGYLKINGFTEATPQDVDSVLGVFAEAGMKGLILDLRENGGGVFDSAIDTARRFLVKGTITSTKHQDPKFNLVYQARNPNALAAPMTVLVDGDTASAAEVLAGALKDNGRAFLIGQTTYGKGCTQCVLGLPNATGNVPTGGMKVTVARFFSPGGVAYSGKGIAPHAFITERADGSMMEGSAYIERAVEELNRMLAMPK